MIQTARKLYAEDSFGLELAHTVYALDSTTIDLCLALFPWARFRKHKGAVKLHTLLDLRGNIPAFIHISDGKLHDVNILGRIAFEAGSFYVMDRGYIDFARLHALHMSQAFFVTRAKANLRYRRIHSRPVDKATGLRCDQTIRLTGTEASQDYPIQLRRVKFYDAKNDKLLVFLTNNFDLPALTIAELYRYRWQVELFFNPVLSKAEGWIKQHLRIKAFFGTSVVPSRHKSGSPSPSMYSSPFSRNAWNQKLHSTQSYRF